MNKINIDGVLIVEGNNDVSYLSSFLNCLFFVTNGYDLCSKKIEFLKEAANRNRLIILTDPDEAGENIRNRLKTQISGVFEAKCRKITRKNTKKSGIAELSKEVVIEALKDYVADKEFLPVNYNLSSLVSLSKSPSNMRLKICEHYRLILGNNKSLENQLNILKISLKEIEDFVRGN